MPRTRKPTTNTPFGEAKLQLSGVTAPDYWTDILKLLFPKNTTRQNLARVLLEELKAAKENREVITTSDWIRIVIRALKEDSVYGELGEFIEKMWKELEEQGVTRPEQVKILTREANEFQAKQIPNKELPPGFGHYRGAWYPTLRTLTKAGMIRQDGTRLELSTAFASKLERIAKLWRKFAGGSEEVW